MNNLKEIFIKEAEKIIREDGLAELSVRKIGKSSGYSYATIYNYFKDLNELLSYCTLNVLSECNEYMKKNASFGDNNFENIQNFASSYFKYFVENPNFFQLVFMEDLGDYLAELMKENKTPVIGNILHKYLLGCLEEGLITVADVSVLRGLISTAIHGRLLLFLKKRDESKIEVHLQSLKKEINYLFKKAN